MRKLFFLFVALALAACASTAPEPDTKIIYNCTRKCGMSCKDFSADDRGVTVQKIDNQTYRVGDLIYKFHKSDDGDEKLYLHNYDKSTYPGNIRGLIVNEKKKVAYENTDNLLCFMQGYMPATDEKLFEPEIYDCPDLRDTYVGGPEHQDGWMIVKDNFGNYNIRNSHEPDWYSGHFYKSWGEMIGEKFYYGSPTGAEQGRHFVYIDNENQTAIYQIRDWESGVIKSQSVCHLTKQD